MVYPTIDSYNLSNGIQVLACYINDATSNVFTSMLLLAVFSIVVIGSYQLQKKTSGSGDLPVALTLGSWVCLIFAIILRLIRCDYNSLVPDFAIGVCVAALGLSLLFLFYKEE